MTNLAPADRHFNATAAVLAWVWPGLGHISLGHKRRGRLIMFGVLFLFLSGVLIGGLDCVDREQDSLWFLAQSLCGPIAFVTDLLNPSYPKHLPSNWEMGYLHGDEQVLGQLARIGLNKPNEMGTLFCALAGLMNLVVILDAMCFVAKPPESRPERRRAVL